MNSGQWMLRVQYCSAAIGALLILGHCWSIASITAALNPGGSKPINGGKRLSASCARIRRKQSH